jgi:hypothetical protein
MAEEVVAVARRLVAVGGVELGRLCAVLDVAAVQVRGVPVGLVLAGVGRGL